MSNIPWKQEYIVYRDKGGKLAAQPYQQGMSPRQIAQWCGSANWLSVEATSHGDAVDKVKETYPESVLTYKHPNRQTFIPEPYYHWEKVVNSYVGQSPLPPPLEEKKAPVSGEINIKL